MYLLRISNAGEAEAIVDGLVGRIKSKLETLGEYGVTFLDSETKKELREIVMLSEKCMEIIDEVHKMREKHLKQMEGELNGEDSRLPYSDGFGRGSGGEIQ